MEFLLIFKSSILPIFIIILIAMIYNRLVKPDIVQIVNITIMVFTPVFVFDSLVKTGATVSILATPVLYMMLLTAALMVLAYGSAWLMRANENERISIVLASSMINIGNFGLPLIYFTYGKEADYYSVIYFVAFSIPLSTVAIYLCSKEKELINILKDIARIPIFHAMILALIVTQFSIPIPEVIEKSARLMGQAAIPLMIFILGLQLSVITVKPGFFRFIIPPVIIRLVISPVIACLIFMALGVSGTEKQVAVVQTSAPAALLPLMYAIRFNRSPDLLAVTILTTTILSGVSLTFLIKYLS